MGSSDSETESECFESAEESFDEKEEKKYEKARLKKNLPKSENDESKPVVSDCDAVKSLCAVEEDVSSSSLSYRKRPERVKRLPSRTQTNPTSKSPTGELIFKADKIVSDVFLQDLTSNFSKNLNKSISTLQQTSSNVKDLILNSLPVSSVNDSEGFSYDDKSILFVDESKTLGPEGSEQDHIQSVELQESFIDENEKENSKDETSTSSKLELLIGRESGNIGRKPEDIGSLKNDFLLTNVTTDDNFKDESLHFVEENLIKDTNLCLDSDMLKVPAENICKKVDIVSDHKKDTIQDFNDTSLNHENYEILTQEDETNGSTNEVDIVNFTEEIDQRNDIFEKDKNICLQPETNVESKGEEETLESKKFFKPVDTDNNENSADLNNFDEKNINCIIEDKNKIHTECNFEELKTALKNIVNDEIVYEKENDNLTTENKKQADESPGDGWDDFDFSDEEVENFNGCNSYSCKELEDIKTNNESTQIKSVSGTCSSKHEAEVETKKSRNLVENEKNIKETSISTKSLAKKTNSSNIKRQEIKEESFKEAEKPKKFSETKIVENDSWGWDNWDEEPESKNTEIRNKMENSEMKKDKDSSLDVSKWSGWDKFGQKPQEKQDNWSIGSWGVDVLLNKATAVTQGISSVLEAGLGAPDPETLARMEKIERENLSDSAKVLCSENEGPSEISKKNLLTNVNIFPVTGITSLVAGVTSKIVEHSKIQEIGSKVISGGLETLETFGKKTMEVLQEGDPGLKNKRALLLGNNKPVLSQVLKEAREKADIESKKVEEKELAKKCHFETLFDDFQGMVHLEALEMLSRQCELKLDQIRSGMNSEEQEDLNGILEEVEQLCSLDEYDIDLKSSVLDFKTSLQMAVEPLKNEISIQNIIQIHEDVSKWLQKSSEADLSYTVLNQKLVSTLAELTAATVHQFHKSGELLSVKECRKTVEEVDALLRLTNALCTEINKLGDKFVELSSNRIYKNNVGDNANSLNEKVNNVMKNSVFYIKQAFNLLIPVIQLGAAV